MVSNFSKSGRCRFGVIYLKPTITDGEGTARASDVVSLGQQSDTPQQWPNISSTASIKRVQLVGVSGGQLNTFDVANLCADYYRSTYNTLVALPVTMGNESPDRLTANKADNDENISSAASSSSFSLPTSTNTSDNEDNDDDKEDKEEYIKQKTSTTKITLKLKRKQLFLSPDDSESNGDNETVNDKCVENDKHLSTHQSSMTTVSTITTATTETSNWMTLKLIPTLTRPDGIKAFPGSAARV